MGMVIRFPECRALLPRKCALERMTGYEGQTIAKRMMHARNELPPTERQLEILESVNEFIPYDSNYLDASNRIENYYN